MPPWRNHGGHQPLWPRSCQQPLQAWGWMPTHHGKPETSPNDELRSAKRKDDMFDGNGNDLRIGDCGPDWLDGGLSFDDLHFKGHAIDVKMEEKSTTDRVGSWQG